MLIESLESRQLLSGNAVAFTVVGTTQVISIQTGIHITKGGTLAIKGTDAADSLSVIRDGKYIKYQTNNGGNLANFFTDASKVKRVLVEAGSGDDRVYVDPNLDKPCTIVGGNGNDRIDGNLGATMIGGNGNDRLFAAGPNVVSAGSGVTVVGVSRIVGPALLSGGAGNDTLIGNDGDDFVGGVGADRGVLYLPNTPPATYNASDGTVGGVKLKDAFKDASGLEIQSIQVGNGKDAVFTGIHDLQRG